MLTLDRLLLEALEHNHIDAIKVLFKSGARLHNVHNTNLLLTNVPGYRVAFFTYDRVYYFQLKESTKNVIIEFLKGGTC